MFTNFLELVGIKVTPNSANQWVNIVIFLTKLDKCFALNMTSLKVVNWINLEIREDPQEKN
jgi:hypothetical protein